jgi:hypothetical protein
VDWFNFASAVQEVKTAQSKRNQPVDNLSNVIDGEAANLKLGGRNLNLLTCNFVTPTPFPMLLLAFFGAVRHHAAARASFLNIRVCECIAHCTLAVESWVPFLQMFGPGANPVKHPFAHWRLNLGGSEERTINDKFFEALFAKKAVQLAAAKSAERWAKEHLERVNLPRPEPDKRGPAISCPSHSSRQDQIVRRIQDLVPHPFCTRAGDGIPPRLAYSSEWEDPCPINGGIGLGPQRIVRKPARRWQRRGLLLQRNLFVRRVRRCSIPLALADIKSVSIHLSHLRPRN